MPRVLVSTKLIGTVSMWVAVMTIFGYPLQVACSLLVGVSPTPINVASRAIYLLVALLILLVTFLRRESRPIATGFLFFLLFWLVYGTRFIYDIEVRQQLLQMGTPSVWTKTKLYQFAFGSCFLSPLGIYFGARYISLPRLAKFLIWFLAVTSTLVLMALLKTAQGDLASLLLERFTVRDESEQGNVLNPILISYTGEVGILISVIGLFYCRRIEVFRPALYVGLGASVLLLLLGASRGPFLVTFILLFWLFAQTVKVRFKSLKFWLLTIIKTSVIVMLLVRYVSLDLLIENFAIFDRFRYMSEQRSNNEGEARDDSYACAWESFVRSPLIGESYLDCYKDYPHNIILEVLMSTGLAGGVLFGCMFYFLFRKYRELGNLLAYERGLMSIQFMVLCVLFIYLTSGALFIGVQFWMVIALLFGLTLHMPGNEVRINIKD
jgi:O-antigen ligase